MDPRLQAELRVAEPSDEEYVDLVFGLVLRRAPEAEARERALAKLADGTLSRATLLHELAAAPELDRIRVLDDAIALALAARERGERPRLLTGPPATDERVVEIPWVLSRARRGAVLEVGYAFAEPVYVAALMRLGLDRLVGVDLATAEVPGMETVEADVRSLPFGDAEFEQVLLVSTLEHIGADNAVYGYERGRDDGAGRADALRELRRVLRPGGSLLVTVPLGEPGDYGWFRQEDVRGWNRLFARAGLFVEEQELYELGEAGWAASPTFRAAGVRYGERGPAASAVLCAELSPDRLRRLASA
ncbi:MAG: methyltransferase domain-containing protein, partial [Actinobacteria bacterium]|nr:methyltransferase domain-containing protein [Actinomycetota bacterium]